MSFIDELNQVIDDLPFNRHQTSKDEIAHFCEHNGIYINFTRARTTWRARAPSAFKPWWLFLEPLRKNLKQSSGKQKQQYMQHKKNNKIINAAEVANKIESIEVTENA